VGELGAGKTQFIKGLAAGAGIRNPIYVSSPSFTLINEYTGRITFYHIDLYRLNEEKEAEELGLEDYFQAEGITAIEWADKIPSLLPKELLIIRIAYIGRNTRSLEIIGKGKHCEEIVNELRIANCATNFESAIRILHSAMSKGRHLDGTGSSKIRRHLRRRCGANQECRRESGQHQKPRSRSGDRRLCDGRRNR
jgi:tRNA threonylcarbamoyladenosine biosynthesis protein TsaE